MLSRLVRLPTLVRDYSSHVSPSLSGHPVRRSTLTDIFKLYRKKELMAVITAHDYITARIADSCDGIDIVLIGDSLAMVSKGYSSTLEIPFEEYYYTCKSVLRAVESKFVIADLPYGSFEADVSQCVKSAIKLMKLGNIGSLKIEGGFEHSGQIKRLVEIGIPVTGHIGLTPQKLHALGGYKVQGKTNTGALSIYKEALHLQKLGCSMLLLECVPARLAQFITEKTSIPTIGIGSGNGTSAQVLVQSDVLGMLDQKGAKFVKRYANFYLDGVAALGRYAVDVKKSAYPDNEQHGYTMKDDEFSDFVEQAKFVK